MTSSDDLLFRGQGGISPSRLRHLLTPQARRLSTHIQLQAKGPIRISSGVQTMLIRATAFGNSANSIVRVLCQRQVLVIRLSAYLVRIFLLGNTHSV